jgi:hypothetical protein
MVPRLHGVGKHTGLPNLERNCSHFASNSS